jgi:GTP cyclohydrolase I
MNKTRIASLVRQLLEELGEDPAREGLLKTPERVAAAWIDLTRGYRQDLKSLINEAVFTSEANNMIIARDIAVYSVCEHHMLPFVGQCHIGYIAKNKVIGLSKMARIVDMFSRRLQIQERLTAQIAHAVRDAVDAEGVGVVINCRHLCMTMRGVEKHKSSMTTSSVLGSFHNDQSTRLEFLTLIGRQESL